MVFSPLNPMKSLWPMVDTSSSPGFRWCCQQLQIPRVPFGLGATELEDLFRALFREPFLITKTKQKLRL